MGHIILMAIDSRLIVARQTASRATMGAGTNGAMAGSTQTGSWVDTVQLNRPWSLLGTEEEQNRHEWRTGEKSTESPKNPTQKLTPTKESRGSISYLDTACYKKSETLFSMVLIVLHSHKL